MKRLLSVLFAIIIAAGAVLMGGCGNQQAAKGDAGNGKLVRIGVTGAADEVIWKPIIEDFKKKNVEIKLVVFNDYTQPNAALANKEIELNSFQHHKFLNNDVKKHGYKIEAIGDTLLAPLNIYSKKIKNIKELKAGNTIAVPNDVVNFGRSLTVLQAAGIIKLKAGVVTPEVEDIVENPLNIKIMQVDASQTAVLLPDVDAAIINGHFSVDAGLNPDKDAIFKDSPELYATNDFINVIVARSEDKDDETLKAIVKAYQSERTKELYKNEFKGVYIPAWK